MMGKANAILKYQPTDFVAEGACHCSNPFMAELNGTFTGPDGRKIIIPGFYDGDGRWIVRFSPNTAGTWEYELTSRDVDTMVSTGRIECIENPNTKVHGGLHVHPQFPHHFQYEDGTEHFMMAYECDWLWALDEVESGRGNIRDFIDSIKNFGFNNILMNVYGYDTFWARGKVCHKDFGPPEAFIWEGTNDEPNHNRFSISFFRKYDRLMNLLLEEGITAHIFLKVYNKFVNWPEKYSRQEDMYFKYIVSRYQAYPNILWDFAKETYYEADKHYVKNRLALVRSLDGYKRLTTVHDDHYFYTMADCGEAADFITLQQHFDIYTSGILERSRRKWPVFNSEFGYEQGPGGREDLTYNMGYSAEELVKKAYEVAMSGAYPCYYYTYTAWDIIDYSHTPPGYAYFKVLYDFFTSVDWWKLQPHPEITCWSGCGCLTDNEKDFIFYVGDHVLFNLDLDGKNYEACFMDILTGQKTSGAAARPVKGGFPFAGELYYWKNPLKDTKVILHIKISDGSRAVARQGTC